MRKVQAASLAAFLAATVLAVCGCGDGDGGGPDADVTGTWEIFMTVGIEAEESYGFVRLVQEGSTATSPDDPSITITLNGSSITMNITVDDPMVGSIDVVCSGIVTGDTMSGTWSATVEIAPGVMMDIAGTWRADLDTRALVDVSGIWSVDWSEDGGPSGISTADLTMAPDGTITGTYDPDYAGPVPATGSLYGYDLTLTVVEASPLDRTITFLATVDATGMNATGTWSDTVGNTGEWDAARP